MEKRKATNYANGFPAQPKWRAYCEQGGVQAFKKEVTFIMKVIKQTQYTHILPVSYTCLRILEIDRRISFLSLLPIQSILQY